MVIDARDHLIGSLADPVKGSLQLRCFLSVRPSGDIGKAVIACLDAVMLGDGVSDSLRLDLLGVSGEPRFLRRQVLRINGMQLLVGHLVNHCLDRLDLAHTFLQGDPLINRVVVALGPGRDILKADRNRAGPFQGFEEHLVICDITGELIYADGG